MSKRLAQLILIVTVTASASALGAAEQDLTGTWVMSVQDMTLGMVLTQTGTKIQGTLESPHGPIAVKGEFDHGTITLSGTSPAGSDLQIALSATGSVQTDGSLAGHLTSNVGEMSWRAVRQRDESHR